EFNNAVAAPIDVTAADLQVPALTVPATAGAGKGIAVTDTTANKGTGSAPGTTTRFYLSTNSVLDAADVALADRSVPALAAGAQSSAPTSLPVPAGTATGSYYVIAQADATSVVTESSETNNTRAAAVKVGPDLQVTALTVPATAGAGKAITVTDT